MAQTQVRILGIAPYEGMKLTMERAAEAYPNVSLDAFVGDLEEGAAIVRQNLANGYDCIISRGGTAEFIRRVTDIPVAEIHLSVYDVLRSIKLCEHYASRYAVVGFPSITRAAHILCDLLRTPLEIYTIHSTEETYETLGALQREGCRMVVGDMVTQTAARRLGMDAFLITSGMESLQAAIEQAVTLSAGFRRLRQENLFLRCAVREKDGELAVLDGRGTLRYSAPREPDAALLEVLREKLAEIPERSVLRFYHNDRGSLYTVSAQTLSVGQSRFYLFYAVRAKIPLRSGKAGVRSFSYGECEHLFRSSFYAVSGAMGEMGPLLLSAAAASQPVMILGEDGTGKEQIARFLYLHSPMNEQPFVVIDCERAVDKTWDYLLNHDNSPLAGVGGTVHLQHLDRLAPARGAELLSLILDTGLQRRQRLIFSCVCRADETPEAALPFLRKLSCITLRLPTLRSRRDEIPSLASLYLASLNQELGKQLSGFEPRAVEQLRAFDWPHNYTQFRRVLQSLAALTAGPYISARAVAEMLSGERGLVRPAHPDAADGAAGTLEEIVQDAIRRTLEAVGGNQTAAAQRLGISRTTMWRHLNRQG